MKLISQMWVFFLAESEKGNYVADSVYSFPSYNEFCDVSTGYTVLSFVKTHPHTLHCAQLAQGAGWLIGKRLLWSRGLDCGKDMKTVRHSREPSVLPLCLIKPPVIGYWWLWQSRMETVACHAESFMWDSSVCGTRTQRIRGHIEAAICNGAANSFLSTWCRRFSESATWLVALFLYSLKPEEQKDARVCFLPDTYYQLRFCRRVRECFSSSKSDLSRKIKVHEIHSEIFESSVRLVQNRKRQRTWNSGVNESSLAKSWHYS